MYSRSGLVMLERLPERARTPAVARAVTSPSAVLLAGAGMSAGVLTGLPVAAAALVGVAAWAARVALAVPRRARGERVQPSAVAEPWRHFVRDALRARDRFAQAVHRSRPGPLRDRLEDVGRRLDQAVDECWRIARQGDSLEGALRQLDAQAVRAELDQIRAERAWARGESTASLERAEQSVRAQLASVERLERVASDAANRLRVLNAQLDEAVAQAVELSVSSSDSSQLSPLSADVDSVVGELETLRQALEETGRPPQAGGTA